MTKSLAADLTRLGDKGTAVALTNRGFHALAIYRVSHLLVKKGIPGIPLLLTRLIQMAYGIDIDPRARIAPGCRILHGVALVIAQDAEIGPGATIYHSVTIGISEGRKQGVPKIGANCTLGAGSKILGGVVLGDNIQVGANAVVVSDIPSNSIAVGVPALAKPTSPLDRGWTL